MCIRDSHACARRVTRHEPRQIFCVSDLLAVESENYVPGLDAYLVARAAGFHMLDEGTTRVVHAERLREVRVHSLDGDAYPTASHVARREELGLSLIHISPERLYLEPPGLPPGTSCQSIAANPEQVLHAPFPAGALPNSYPCLPNNISWANMMSELGMAIAPPAFHPARTTGLGGFALSFQASYTHINANAMDQTGTQYWHQGTQGAVDTNKNQFSVVNNSPDSILQVYTLNARKGLAYGFEINGALGYVSNTSLWVGGADVHWSLLEEVGASTPEDPAAREFVGIILEEVNRLDRVVGSFLDYARPHAGNPIPLDLNAAVRRTVQILSSQITDGAIDLKLDPVSYTHLAREGSVRVRGPRGALRRHSLGERGRANRMDDRRRDARRRLAGGRADRSRPPGRPSRGSARDGEERREVALHVRRPCRRGRRGCAGRAVRCMPSRRPARQRVRIPMTYVSTRKRSARMTATAPTRVAMTAAA